MGKLWNRIKSKTEKHIVLHLVGTEQLMISIHSKQGCYSGNRKTARGSGVWCSGGGGWML